MPENEMHMSSFWLTLGHSLLADLPFSLSERQSGIFGLLYALGSMATLLMMCDRRDLGTSVGERPPSAATEINLENFATGPSTGADSKEFFEPNLYIYDAYPGGIGFSEPLYRVCNTLLNRTLELISACSCENGCPSCVGPTADRNERTKDVALEILARICGDTEFIASSTTETRPGARRPGSGGRQPKPISTENIFQSAAGALSRLDIRLISAP
jgi:DEAD/DEAH box helicase domain-containing protein